MITIKLSDGTTVWCETVQEAKEFIATPPEKVSDKVLKNRYRSEKVRQYSRNYYLRNRERILAYEAKKREWKTKPILTNQTV